MGQDLADHHSGLSLGVCLLSSSQTGLPVTARGTHQEYPMKGQLSPNCCNPQQ